MPLKRLRGSRSFAVKCHSGASNESPDPIYIQRGFLLCILAPRSDLTGVSLNRYEQMLLDYVREHQDETLHWKGIIRELGATHPNRIQRSRELNRLLWAYFRERASNVSPFSDVFTQEGQSVVSMQNLADYLIARWTPEPRFGHRA